MSDKLPSELANMINDYLKPELYVIVCYSCSKDDPIVIDVVDKSQIQSWLDKVKCIEFAEYDYNNNAQQSFITHCDFSLSNDAKFFIHQQTHQKCISILVLLNMVVDADVAPNMQLYKKKIIAYVK